MKRGYLLLVCLLMLLFFGSSVEAIEIMNNDYQELLVLCNQLSNLNLQLKENLTKSEVSLMQAEQQLQNYENQLTKLQSKLTEAEELLMKAQVLLNECETSLKTARRMNNKLLWQRNIAYIISFFILIFK
jgi:septal ring factor EnvC (AmiA/AmiB activator)